MKITVIDDDEFSRENLRALLGLKGYRVIVATGPEDALPILRRGAPDLILIKLSNEASAEFVNRLKADDHLDSIPVLVLPKKYDEDALVENVRKILER